MIKIQNYNTKKLKAFSLTEVLITMFVIMMVVIAAAPVITKKQIKNNKPHGVWECTLNGNNIHISTMSIDGGGGTTTKTEGAYCTFDPPASSENFSVTVIGGGGGGASGATSTKDAVSYGSPIVHRIETAGQYDILVVGGGGGGSASYGTQGNYGGSAGKVAVRQNAYLSPGYYTLEAGTGGKAGGNPNLESDGTSETPTECGENSWTDDCNGGDGNKSRIYNAQGGLDITADGGKRGSRYKSEGNNDTDGCTSRTGKKPYGGKIFTGGNGGTGSTCGIARQMLGSAASTATFGHGGDGSTSRNAYPGYNGIVMIMSSAFYGGGGGKQGNVGYMTIKRIKKPVKVYVGAGGAGATVENTNGLPGENSSFGNYISAKGGQGGEIKAISSTSKTSGIRGENGSESPYGQSLSGAAGSCSAAGLNGGNNMNTNTGYSTSEKELYGAGGGGGGAFSHRTTSCGLTQKWGFGGRGAPGYVRVEWN